MRTFLHYLAILFAFFSLTSAWVANYGTTCYLYPESLTHYGQPVDDTPSIVQAATLCGTNGTIVFVSIIHHLQDHNSLMTDKQYLPHQPSSKHDQPTQLRYRTLGKVTME